MAFVLDATWYRIALKSPLRRHDLEQFILAGRSLSTIRQFHAPGASSKSSLAVSHFPFHLFKSLIFPQRRIPGQDPEQHR